MSTHKPARKYITALIRRETLDNLYSNYPFALVGILVVATAIFLELYFSNVEGQYLTENRLLGWYLAVIIILAARVCLYFGHIIFGHSILQRPHYILIAILSCITALLFGLIASVLMPNDIAHQAYVLILLSGLIGGSVQSLSVSYHLNIIYVLLALVPTLIWQYAQISSGNTLYIGILICMMVFCLFSLQVARQNYNAQIANIALKAENAHMIHELEILCKSKSTQFE